MPLTKDQANHAKSFEHVTEKNKDGTPLRARRNGATKTWKTRPDEFKVPVKHGLYTTFYITNENAHSWNAVGA